MNLNPAIAEGAAVLRSECSLHIEQSTLVAYTERQWAEFCEKNRFDPKAEGLYVPHAYRGYIRTDSPSRISNAFHELFGHGTFCEHAALGRELVDATRRGNGNEHLAGNSAPFGIVASNIGNYEGFALWLERLLCEETGNKTAWIAKRDRLPEQYVQLSGTFQDAEAQLTRFGFMAQLGFPKRYDRQALLSAMQKVYGSAFGDVELIILYGSQKPESDIDLVVVRDGGRHWNNGWLDVSEYGREEFASLAALCDIEVTAALFTGEPLHDPANLFQEYRRTALDAPITEAMIAHSERSAREQEGYSVCFEGSALAVSESYVRSYRAIASGLRQGRKLLTREDIDSWLCQTL